MIKSALEALTQERQHMASSAPAIIGTTIQKRKKFLTRNWQFSGD